MRNRNKPNNLKFIFNSKKLYDRRMLFGLSRQQLIDQMKLKTGYESAVMHIYQIEKQNSEPSGKLLACMCDVLELDMGDCYINNPTFEGDENVMAIHSHILAKKCQNLFFAIPDELKKGVVMF